MARTPRAAKTATTVTQTRKDDGIKLVPTQMRHVFQMDIDDSGTYREVVVVKRHANGSVSYIVTSNLDQVDRGRLASVLRSQHADKYEMWDLLSQNTLSNGLNALDYFHQVTRVKVAKGATVDSLGSTSLLNAAPESGAMVGSGFTDPSGGTMSDIEPNA